MPSSDKSSAVSSALNDLTFYNYPLITPKSDAQKEEKDWVKIGAIVAAVIGGLTIALAVLCIMRFLPFDLLGGPLGIGITIIVGAAILLPAAYILFERWRNSS